MGYIYKITNMINNKVYIGQTIKTVEKRFQQHKNNSKHPYFSQIVLYKAFNKYGIENFKCETIEEIENSLLDEREKYWIEYYNSYFEGYNSTLGGRLVQLYNFDVDDIIEKYYELKSARAVAKIIGCDHGVIDNILNINGVKRFSKDEIYGYPIRLYNNKESLDFISTTKAAQWLIDNNKTKSKSLRNVRQYLNRFSQLNKTYVGYYVMYLK